MSFTSDFQSAMAGALDSYFGESITYTPASTGIGLALIARVRRNEPTALPNQGGARPLLAKIEVWVPMSRVSRVVIGGDTVKLPPRAGESAVTFAVKRILGSGGGEWHLALE